MKKVLNGTGAGDPGVIIDQKTANAMIPENPGWQSEAAFRHHDHPMAEDQEMSANQSVPGPEEDVSEPQLHFETLGFREPTNHEPS